MILNKREASSKSSIAAREATIGVRTMNFPCVSAADDGTTIVPWGYFHIFFCLSVSFGATPSPTFLLNIDMHQTKTVAYNLLTLSAICKPLPPKPASDLSSQLIFRFTIYLLGVFVMYLKSTSSLQFWTFYSHSTLVSSFLDNLITLLKAQISKIENDHKWGKLCCTSELTQGIYHHDLCFMHYTYCLCLQKTRKDSRAQVICSVVDVSLLSRAMSGKNTG